MHRTFFRRLSFAVPVVLVGLNDAVTPLGRPDSVNETLPVKVPTSVTVMVSVPLLP